MRRSTWLTVTALALLPVLLAVLVLLLVSQSPLERAQRDLRSRHGAAPGVKTVLAENEATRHDWTQEEAADLARRFDLIFYTSRNLPSYAGAMTDANARVLLTAYVNSAFAQKTQGPGSGAFPTDLYARDSAGNPVRSRNFGNYLMKFWDSRWSANRCTAGKTAAAKVAGVFWDMLTTAPVRTDYSTGVPVNPATGKGFTEAEYQQAIRAHGKRLMNCLHNADKISVGNTYNNGQVYFRSSKAMTDAVDVGLAEGFFTASCANYSEAGWLSQVRMLEDVAARGTQMAVLAKSWCSTMTVQQKQQREMLAFATFQLGNDGRSYYNGSIAGTTRTETVNELWSQAMGTPEAAMFRTPEGLYRREWSQATVIVNPASTSRGGQAPYSGRILLK